MSVSFKKEFKSAKYVYYKPEALITLDKLARNGYNVSKIIKLMGTCIFLYMRNPLLYRRAVFTIGQLVHTRFKYRDKMCYGYFIKSDLVCERLAIAVILFRDQIELTENAIRAWLIIGRRLRVVKDIRIMISKMIWADRSDTQINSVNTNRIQSELGNFRN